MRRLAAALIALALAPSAQAQTLPTAAQFGSITFKGSSSGSSTIAAPASGSTITITLPGTAGTSGQVLTHGVGDTLAWASAASVANALLLETAGTSQKISALSAFNLAAPPTGAEPLATVQGGVTVKVTLAQLYTLFAAWLDVVAINPLNAAGGSGSAGREVVWIAGTGDGPGNGGATDIEGGASDAGAGGAVFLVGGGSTAGVGGRLTIGPGVGGAGNGPMVLQNIPFADPSVGNAVWFDRGVLEQSGSTPALVHTDVAQSFTKAQRGAPVTLSLSGATATPDFDAGQNFDLTLLHVCPCTLANPSTTPVAGQAGQIVVTQSATGSDTLAFGNQFKFAGGVAPTLSTGANAVDVLSYFVVSPTFIVVTALLNFQ